MGEQRNAIEGPDGAPPASRTRRLGLRLFGWLTSWLLRALGATWRIQTLGVDPRVAPPAGDTSNEARLAALFHESMLPCAHLFRDRGYGVVVSRSRDGDLIDATLRGLGYTDAVRGSSSRGGTAALLGLKRLIGEGTTVSVLVDGPRGPARVAKTGIVSLARHTDRPIQPVAFSARPAIRLESWDRTLIPLPFARVVCAFGEPLSVDSDADEAAEQSAARKLERRLDSLHHEADHLLL